MSDSDRVHRSYRLSSALVKELRRASNETGASERELVEMCLTLGRFFGLVTMWRAREASRLKLKAADPDADKAWQKFKSDHLKGE